MTQELIFANATTEETESNAEIAARIGEAVIERIAQGHHWKTIYLTAREAAHYARLHFGE